MARFKVLCGSYYCASSYLLVVFLRAQNCGYCSLFSLPTQRIRKEDDWVERSFAEKAVFGFYHPCPFQGEGDHVAVYNYLVWGWILLEKIRANISYSGKIWGDKRKSEHGKFGLDTTGYFSTFRIFRLRTGYPESLPKYPWNCWKLYWTKPYPGGLLCAEGELDTAEISSNLHYSVFLKITLNMLGFQTFTRLELSCQEFYRRDGKANFLEREFIHWHLNC